MKSLKLIVSLIVAAVLPLAAQAPRSIQPPAPVSIPTRTEQALLDINTFSVSSYRSLVPYRGYGLQ